MRTVNVSGSTSICGSASFSGRSALPRPRTSTTGTSARRTAIRAASPLSTAAGATKASEVAAATTGAAPHIGRGSTGCGVGMEAFGSPIAAQATMPPLRTACGRTPKNAGSQSTRSASLPGCTEPTSPSIPCATAGQIVYLAT